MRRRVRAWGRGEGGCWPQDTTNETTERVVLCVFLWEERYQLGEKALVKDISFASELSQSSEQVAGGSRERSREQGGDGDEVDLVNEHLVHWVGGCGREMVAREQINDEEKERRQHTDQLPDNFVVVAKVKESHGLVGEMMLGILW